MLRRCILELSLGRSFRRPPRRITPQMPSFLSSRSKSSTTSQPTSSQGPTATSEKPSGGMVKPVSMLIIGTIIIGTAAGATFGEKLNVKDKIPFLQTSKIDDIQGLKVAEHSDQQAVLPSKEPSELTPKVEVSEKNDEALGGKDKETSSEGAAEVVPEEVESSPVEESKLSSISPDNMSLPPVKEEDLTGISQDNISPPEEQTAGREISSVDNVDLDNGLTHIEDSKEQNNLTDNLVPLHEEIATTEPAPSHLTPEEMPKDSLNHESDVPSPLPEAYSLERDEEGPEFSPPKETTVTFPPCSKEKEALEVTTEGSKDTNEHENQKIVLDFIQAIHAAEKRQAESDFHIFDEEKRLLKEKYEKELRDARARELMYAEEAAILDKELNKEKAKAVTTVKLLQEKAEENLRTKLQHKEEETELQGKKIQELAKAELNAAIAKEKSSQMEKIAEANLHINALCMAFYARSEEARQSYSVHKLALGALALEDALSKGLPIRAEIDVLHTSLAGIDRDSLLDLVLTSLPEETLNYGTDTLLKLSQKFDALKGTLRHFSLIPPGGGGILAHTVAHIASSIKMRERNQSGDGIESVISRVDTFLAEGKLAEAAEALEEGVSGTQAEGAIVGWVKQARNRAVTEQALALFQAYATSVGLT